MKKVLAMLVRHRFFWLIVIIGIILRIALNSAVDSFDFYAFVMWAKYLSVHRMADVFEFLPEGYTPYPPLYYYVLKAIGIFNTFIGVWDKKWLTYLIIRLPMIVGDVLVTTLIYRFAYSQISKIAAIVGAAFFMLHPATIYNTAIWGQIDSVVTLLGLMSVLAFIDNKPFWGIGIYMLGVITKLQILALLPLILLCVISIKNRKNIIAYLAFWSVVVSLPFLPIVFAKGLSWTRAYFFTIPNWYAYTSVYTYNLWAPLGFIVSDNTKLLGLVQYKYAGIFLFWLVALIILKPLFQVKNRKPLVIMFAAFLLWYDFSYFATRIHSRYLIYSFGFFAPFMKRYPKLGLALSILMSANLLLPNKDLILLPLVNLLNRQVIVICFTIFAFLLFLLFMKAYRTLIK